MMDVESSDSVFIDLESEALLRPKVADMRIRLDQKPKFRSTTSSTFESCHRTRAVRLMSSLSDEVNFYQERREAFGAAEEHSMLGLCCRLYSVEYI